MFKSRGVLNYSPLLNGSLSRRGGGSTKWWLILNVDPEIGKYYRQLYTLAKYRTTKLQRPLWEAHISVVRDEEPAEQYKFLWNKYNGEGIEFEFDTTRAQADNVYVWFPVTCEAALDVREELGLPRQSYFPLHMTIGNLK